MYDRAVDKLRTILQSKGIKDSSNVIKDKNYGMIHFHIDASEDNI
jgi:hypothetical protein